MSTKYTNQIQSESNFNPSVGAQPFAQNDSQTTINNKFQATLFSLGAGQYIGKWDAATNTPNLSNSTIEAAGNWYNVIISTGAPTAIVDFGAGPIEFTPNDAVYSTGAIYTKRDLPDSSIQLPDGQLLIGQVNGLGAPKPVTGDVLIADTGETTLAFQVNTTPGAFNPAIRGGGTQYFNTNQSIDMTTMIIGRKYKLYNSDTLLHTLTFTGGTGAALIGGDALTNGLIQSVNQECLYTFTRQNALTVLVE